MSLPITAGTKNYLDSREKLPYIRTYYGIKFRHLDPWPFADVYIEDIAHALSNLCRFTGHVRQFYSVAEHSVRVSYLVPDKHALWGLLHDASEAYCNDLARPLKYAPGLEGYKAIEKLVQQAVCLRFYLDSTEPPIVKEADNLMLATEGRDLFFGDEHFGKSEPIEGYKIEPWTPAEAKNRFLMRFYELTGEREFYKKYEGFEEVN